MLAEQTVAGLIIGIVHIDVTAGGSLVVVVDPGHLLLAGAVPYHGVRGAVGAGDGLDLFLIHQPVGQLGTVAGIVVEVLVIVDAPVTMEAGIQHNKIVGADLQAVLIESRLDFLRCDNVPDGAFLNAGDLCIGTHLGRIAFRCIESFLKLIIQIGQIHDHTGADGMLQLHLSQGIAIALTVHFFLMEGVVGGVAVGGGMQRAGIGVGALVETLQILATGELQVSAGTREGPEGCVPAPGLAEIPDLGHLIGFQIEFALVKGHVCHNEFLLLYDFRVIKRLYILYTLERF